MPPKPVENHPKKEGGSQGVTDRIWLKERSSVIEHHPKPITERIRSIEGWYSPNTNPRCQTPMVSSWLPPACEVVSPHLECEN